MEIRWDRNGLVPAIVQDARSGEVLTLAWMNAEALSHTVQTGETWFYSRSRRELWHKGATSGNTQKVVGLSLDCDGDAVLVQVEPNGPACHTGARGCFFEPVPGADVAAVPRTLAATLASLERVIVKRRDEMPEGSYTSYLFEQGLDKILKKVGEEATEVVIAAKNPDDAALTGEVADLLYHLTVLVVERGLSLDDIARKLKDRAGSERRRR